MGGVNAKEQVAAIARGVSFFSSTYFPVYASTANLATILRSWGSERFRTNQLSLPSTDLG